MFEMPQAGSTAADFFAAAFAASPEARLVVSEDDRIICVNAAALAELGVADLHAAQALHMSEAFATKSREDWQILREGAARGDAPQVIGELSAGQRRRVCATTVELPDGAKAMLVVLRPVEARAEPSPPARAVERATADAALAQERLAAIVESCYDAIVGKTLEGVVTSWNLGAERLFGYTAAEMIGAPIHRIIPPERRDEESMILSRLRQGERVEHLETERVRKDGRRVDVSMTVSPIRNVHGTVVGASKVARDISERRRLDEARERLLEAERHAREQAQRDSLVKDEFLATLSHELRTPLAAIQAWGHLLSVGKVKAEEMRQAGEVIERNAVVQRRVIEDLLDVSRIVAGKIRLEVGWVEPAVVVRAALDTVMPAANAKNIRMITALDEDTGLLRADSTRLQQVIWNLLSNAVKFTPEAGEVRVSLQGVDPRTVRLTVADSGAGIEPAFLPRIFDRFSQGDASPSRKHGGLGLGLAIAKQITALHGGTIQASSPGIGLGATFIVELPREAVVMHAARSPRADVATDTPEPGETDLSGVDVLIVEDEADTRQLLERILRDSGASVVVTDSAFAALVAVDEHPPDVLLSDIGMPGMDGYELLRQIRSRDTNVRFLPAIALTAFARPKDRLNALRAGYVAHLTKPAEPAQLIATVAAAAGRVARCR
jgi:PAS domain S-box-containing protein